MKIKEETGSLNGLILFISYCHDDRPLSNNIRKAVESYGARVWQDYREVLPGEDIQKQLLNALRGCHGVILLLTPNSLKSMWVHIELGVTWGTETTLFPVVHGLEVSQLPVPLQSLQSCAIDEIEELLIPALARLRDRIGLKKKISKTDLIEITAKAAAEAGYSQQTREIAELIAPAFSEDRNIRRATHISIRQTPFVIKKMILNTFNILTKHSNDLIRGESYYCLGDIPDDDGNYVVTEKFLQDGLYDKSPFVMACCANVLQNFIPLEAKTVNRLKECIYFHGPGANTNPDISRLVYWALRTLDVHRKGSQ